MTRLFVPTHGVSAPTCSFAVPVCSFAGASVQASVFRTLVPGVCVKRSGGSSFQLTNCHHFCVYTR